MSKPPFAMSMFCFLFQIAHVWAQDTDQQIYEEVKVSIHQIHVNVVGSDGDPIRDLTRADFVIELNGKPQPLESVFNISLLRDVLEAGVENPDAELPTLPEHGRRQFVA